MYINQIKHTYQHELPQSKPRFVNKITKIHKCSEVYF